MILVKNGTRVRITKLVYDVHNSSRIQFKVARLEKGIMPTSEKPQASGEGG
jgi:hypothetical protein